MRVTGKPVTEDQAKEIIRRTDSAFQHLDIAGNNHEHRTRLTRLYNYPVLNDDSYPKYFEERVKWFEAWGFIQTEYVHNDWIASAFIMGPHGWCHPNGQIGFVDNVGKWPTIEHIQREWGIIAKAFSFLDVGATLYSGESCAEGIEAVVSLRIRSGKVTLKDPHTTDVHKGHPPATRSDGGYTDAEFVALRFGPYRNLRLECGVPDAWLEEWGERLETKETP